MKNEAFDRLEYSIKSFIPKMVDKGNTDHQEIIISIDSHLRELAKELGVEPYAIVDGWETIVVDAIKSTGQHHLLEDRGKPASNGE